MPFCTIIRSMMHQQFCEPVSQICTVSMTIKVHLKTLKLRRAVRQQNSNSVEGERRTSPSARSPTSDNSLPPPLGPAFCHRMCPRSSPSCTCYRALRRRTGRLDMLLCIFIISLWGHTTEGQDQLGLRINEVSDRGTQNLS